MVSAAIALTAALLAHPTAGVAALLPTVPGAPAAPDAPDPAPRVVSELADAGAVTGRVDRRLLEDGDRAVLLVRHADASEAPARADGRVPVVVLYVDVDDAPADGPTSTAPAWRALRAAARALRAAFAQAASPAGERRLVDGASFAAPGLHFVSPPPDSAGAPFAPALLVDWPAYDLWLDGVDGAPPSSDPSPFPGLTA